MSEQQVLRRYRPDWGVIEEYAPGNDGESDQTLRLLPADSPAD